ncbi:MAG: DUF4886 domain-containing protein [Clostridia bacterium]|nr:DUF4886 domain-containing protein [Clostridia bacterium]MBQ9919247.1 DUF4886 domain-containing protein [Clostridia bacterium]
MQVLSIGNSFSQDAQRYLSRIARADSMHLQSTNLIIGGCPLSRHYRNMFSEKPSYALEVNGISTGFFVSLKEALLNRDWNVITIQQVSQKAPYYESYQPYLNEVIAYVRKLCPKAKIAVHQTWAYEEGSARLVNELKYSSYKDMLSDIIASYKKAAEEINADLIIPSGEVFGAMIENGIEKVHRDTFHASLGLGRYALGLTWYKFLTGRDISENSFNDFDEEVTPEQIEIVKKSVTEIAQKYGA